jgi:hypothetical protein
MRKKIISNLYYHAFRGNDLVVTVLLPKENYESRKNARVVVFIKGRISGGSSFDYSWCLVDGDGYTIGFAVVENLNIVYCENDTSFQVFCGNESVSEVIPL